MSQGNDKNPLTEAVYYILLALRTPLHGYGIMQFVKEISHERVHLGPGTLYGAIKTMQEKGWIQSIDDDSDSRKKQYELTKLGRDIVLDEISRLHELVDNGDRIMRGDKGD